MAACSGGGGSSAGTANDTSTAIDIKDAIFNERSADCATYANTYTAAVVDITRSMGFTEAVSITSTDSDCSLTSNNIPNHDFNDNSANFHDAVAEVNQSFTIPRSPAIAGSATQLSQTQYNAIMLNGVPLDILSAGCYKPTDAGADADGNVQIGCNDNSAWLLDPLGTTSKFGADAHNAHTQPNGSYHYHGNPVAMFDDNPGPNGSPVIGFAADGFPIYGSYFLDQNTGSVRKALSGYTLKTGSRVTIGGLNPGGTYDGTYNDDWEHLGATGDLDECNGMTVDGQYGYYVTEAFPWVMRCLAGTADSSFNK